MFSSFLSGFHFTITSISVSVSISSGNQASNKMSLWSKPLASPTVYVPALLHSTQPFTCIYIVVYANWAYGVRSMPTCVSAIVEDFTMGDSQQTRKVYWLYCELIPDFGFLWLVRRTGLALSTAARLFNYSGSEKPLRAPLHMMIIEHLSTKNVVEKKLHALSLTFHGLQTQLKVN